MKKLNKKIASPPLLRRTSPTPYFHPLIFGGVPTSLCHFFYPSIHSSICPSVHLSIRPSVHPSICHTPCLRNHTSSDHNSWYTYVNWWYLSICLERCAITRACTSTCLNQFMRTKICMFKYVLQTLHCTHKNFLHNNLTGELTNWK